MPADPASRLRFACPRCGKSLTAPRSAAGRRARCPACGEVTAVPGQPATASTKPSAASFNAPNPISRSAAEQAAPHAGASSDTPWDDLLPLAPADPGLAQARRSAPPLAAATTPGPVCPSCRQQLSVGAKVCVPCGVYVRSGRPILITQDEHLDHIYMFAERLIWWLSWIDPIGMLPIASEAFGTYRPWTTRILMLLTVVTSVLFWVATWNAPLDHPANRLLLWSGVALSAADWEAQLRADPNLPAGEDVPALAAELAAWQAQGGFEPQQLLTHQFLHADLFHLLGNLLFLGVLGSRVNALIGNLWTALLYPCLGVLAALTHMLMLRDAPMTPSLGASGAIMGMAGMYLALFPIHSVHVAGWFRWGLLGGFRLHLNVFAIRGFWIVSLYVALDALYTFLGANDDVAHWAHLGGFGAGFSIGLILLVARLVNARGGDVLTTALGSWAWPLVGRPGDQDRRKAARAAVMAQRGVP